jgi:hypothetical protein
MTSLANNHRIQAFVEQIHPSIPLFDRAACLSFCDEHGSNAVLRKTVAAIATAILNLADNDTQNAAHTYLSESLELLSIGNATSARKLALIEFQRACLLTYYNFHQGPSHASWMRIGALVRQAYGMGLHDVDGGNHETFASGALSISELQPWRRLWWMIYCLDSYSNITNGMPCMVERETIRTNLPLLHMDGQICTKLTSVTLAYENSKLWETVRSLPDCGHEHDFDIHIVMTSLIRESATVYRHQRLAPKRSLRHLIVKCEDNIVSTRLALPIQYHKLARNLWSNESVVQYHARLINLILQHMSTLLALMAITVAQDVDFDITVWDRMLNTCNEIVIIVKNMDCTHLAAIDPAVCFIFSTVLAVLQLYLVCQLPAADSSAQEELSSMIERQKRILLLFLENFSAHWFLPRFLIGECAYCQLATPMLGDADDDAASFESFSKIIVGEPRALDGSRVLRAYESFLHQKWLSYLSVTEAQLPVVSNLGDDSWIENWVSFQKVSTSDLTVANVVCPLLKLLDCKC